MKFKCTPVSFIIFVCVELKCRHIDLATSKYNPNTLFLWGTRTKPEKARENVTAQGGGRLVSHAVAQSFILFIGLTRKMD